jgi:hypothetical protein
VNKTELIEHIANNADISKAAAARALDSTIEAVKKTLKRVVQCRSLVLAHSPLASALLVRAATPAPAILVANDESYALAA